MSDKKIIDGLKEACAKVYVPSPGRPPEWVVDLMVEGRVSKRVMTDGDDKWVAYGSRPPEDGWEVWRQCGKGQAIRLNEDGSLEIIDAPEADTRPKPIDVNFC